MGYILQHRLPLLCSFLDPVPLFEGVKRGEWSLRWTPFDGFLASLKLKSPTGEVTLAFIDSFLLLVLHINIPVHEIQRSAPSTWCPFSQIYKADSSWCCEPQLKPWVFVTLSTRGAQGNYLPLWSLLAGTIQSLAGILSHTLMIIHRTASGGYFSYPLVQSEWYLYLLHCLNSW